VGEKKKKKLPYMKKVLVGGGGGGVTNEPEISETFNIPNVIRLRLILVEQGGYYELFLTDS